MTVHRKELLAAEDLLDPTRSYVLARFSVRPRGKKAAEEVPRESASSSARREKSVESQQADVRSCDRDGIRGDTPFM
jgi:hypothetical protein